MYIHQFFGILCCLVITCLPSISSLTRITGTVNRYVGRESNPHLSRQAQYNTGALSGCAALDFSIPVRIGSQGPFSLIVDTGSTTMGVAGSTCVTNCVSICSDICNPSTCDSSCKLCTSGCNGCNSCNQCTPNCNGVSPTWNASLSSTAGLISSTIVSQLYADGSGWQGPIYSDLISIGSTPFFNASFVSMTSAPEFFPLLNCNFDSLTADVNVSQGILGFAYPVYESSQNPYLYSPIDHLPKVTGLPDEFAIQMCDSTGNVWFGGFDPNATTSAMQYVNLVQPPGFYKVFWTGIDFSINDSSLTTFQATSYGATDLGNQCGDSVPDCTIIDSGTSLFQLPQAAYNAIVQRMTASTVFLNAFSSHYFSDNLCVTPNLQFYTTSVLNAHLPRMRLHVSSQPISNISTDVLLDLDPVSSYLLETIIPVSPGNYITYYCPGIAAYPNNVQDMSIFGFPVLNQYVVHIQRYASGSTPARIGFAKQNKAYCNIADASTYIPSSIPTVSSSSSSSSSSASFSQSSSSSASFFPSSSSISSNPLLSSGIQSSTTSFSSPTLSPSPSSSFSSTASFYSSSIFSSSSSSSSSTALSINSTSPSSSFSSYFYDSLSLGYQVLFIIGVVSAFFVFMGSLYIVISKICGLRAQTKIPTYTQLEL